MSLPFSVACCRGSDGCTRLSPRQNGNLDRLQAVVSDAQATIALTTDSILSTVERRFADWQGLANLNWLCTDELNADMAADWRFPDVGSDTLAFLQYTSGSTSSPKGVMLTHGNLLHNLSMIEQSFGTKKQDRGVIWLPPYHDMGLIGGILQPLYTGYPMHLMAPVDFITRPLRWLELISRTGATVSGGPNFAYDLCVQKITPEQREGLDLSAWSVAFTGAEPVREETLERFAEYFAPCGFRKEAFYPCYGLAEGTLLVTGGQMEALPIVKSYQLEALKDDQAVTADTGDAEAQTLVSSGTVWTGDQQVVIVDPVSLEGCAEQHVGEIWVVSARILETCPANGRDVPSV